MPDGSPLPQFGHPPTKQRKNHKKDVAEADKRITSVMFEQAVAGWRFDHPRTPLAPGSPEADFIRRNAQYMKSIGGTTGAIVSFGWRLIVNLVYLSTGMMLLGAFLGIVESQTAERLVQTESSLKVVHRGSEWGWAVIAVVYVLEIFLVNQLGNEMRKSRAQAGITAYASAKVVRLRELLVLSTVILFLAIALPTASRLLLAGYSRPDVGGAGLGVRASTVVTTLWGGLLIIAGVAQGLGKGLTLIGSKVASTRRAQFAAFVRLAIVKTLLALTYLLYPLFVITLATIGYLIGLATFPPSAWQGARALFVFLCFIEAYICFASPQWWSLHRPYMARVTNCFGINRQTHSDDGKQRAVARSFRHSPHLSTLSNVSDVPELLLCASVNVTDRAVSAAGSHVRPLVFSGRALRLYAGDTFELDTRQVELALAVRGRLRSGQTTPYFYDFGFQCRIAEAVAISGAAVSPSMGRMTKGAFRSLLACLNLRLGQWIPNPASPDMQRAITRHAQTANEPGSKSLKLKPRYHYYIRETLGLHPLSAKFVYATDGGHYENLGIVELFRRRCTEIWCIDASADPPGSCMALSEALLIAQGELGVRVKMDLDSFNLDHDRTVRGRPIINEVFAEGTFRYPDQTEGLLHVVKLGIGKDTPDFLKEMRSRYKRFPYDSTLNQLYTAERFDLYRELGYDSTMQAAASARRSRDTRADLPAQAVRFSPLAGSLRPSHRTEPTC
ncbi:MAG TPA: hypothetical protein VJ851_11535 [Jatrophihabitans sp.]|nr:hypothetical protein [Jatrophihabitans sp.]